MDSMEKRTRMLIQYMHDRFEDSWGSVNKVETLPNGEYVVDAVRKIVASWRGTPAGLHKVQELKPKGKK
jgi:hypothetical protein